MSSKCTPENPWNPIEFPVGTLVKIADLNVLEEFLQTWQLHHKLQPEQLAFAGEVAEVRDAGMYHGGRVVYYLKEVPGAWHQNCLSKAD